MNRGGRGESWIEGRWVPAPLEVSSTSCRVPAFVLSAMVWEKKVMNCPTEERWKKLNVERS
jgi:hypothetical protein